MFLTATEMMSRHRIINVGLHVRPTSPCPTPKPSPSPGPPPPPPPAAAAAATAAAKKKPQQMFLSPEQRPLLRLALRRFPNMGASLFALHILVNYSIWNSSKCNFPRSSQAGPLFWLGLPILIKFAQHSLAVPCSPSKAYKHDWRLRLLKYQQQANA